MDVLCVQETRWRSDSRLFGAIGKRYKLFLMGNEAKTDGVGIFVAEKWADSDMNGHVGSSNAGYDGTHGGFGYGSRNDDGSRILEFADGLNLVICNTLFTKQ